MPRASIPAACREPIRDVQATKPSGPTTKRYAEYHAPDQRPDSALKPDYKAIAALRELFSIATHDAEDPTMADEQQKTNIQMRIDDSRATTTYANAFRHNATPQEIIMDFGVNLVTPTRQASDGEPGEATMNFKIDNRLVLNYVTAKRLAGTLVQIVQAHEKRFGEIKLDQQG